MKTKTAEMIIRSIGPRPDTDDSRRITLHVDSGNPPISGRLQLDSEPSRAFTGWISLLAALETAIGTDPERVVSGSASHRAKEPAQADHTEVRDAQLDD